jgi:predicted aspartyl protease
MKISNGGTNYVSATLADSVTASFLVDTGSGMLVVNQDTFKALKQNKDIQFSHEAAARLANGKLHRVDVYTVNQFRIGAHCEIGKVDVAVIKKGNNILGMSALKKAAPFAMSVNPPTLLLSHCPDVLASNLATLAQR